MNLSGRDAFPAAGIESLILRRATRAHSTMAGLRHWPRPILEPSVFSPTISGAGWTLRNTLGFGGPMPGHTHVRLGSVASASPRRHLGVGKTSSRAS